MTRAFTMRDQAAFAAFSGDANPMHTDPVQARRMLYGRPVAHGMHLILWALDETVAPDGPFSLRSIRVRFLAPVFADTAVSLTAERDGDRHRISISADGRLRANLDLTVSPPETAPTPMPLPFRAGECRRLTARDLPEARGGFPVGLDAGRARTLFPALAATLAPAQLASLAALSTLVGMHCPGLDSVFSGFEAEAAAGPSGRCEYETVRFDDRFSLVKIGFSLPGLRGALQAFLRPGPVAQPACRDLSGLVEPTIFSRVRALILGGSRGLGEATAKLLALGGADVRLTYSQGHADAERVCADIAAAGGRCSSQPYDVLAPDRHSLDDAGPRNALFYYPTPPIFQGAPGPFSPGLFQTFASVYLDGFAAVLDRLPKEELTVLYPSTVAVDELPPDMKEYACAKAAGETLCRFLAAGRAGLTIHCPRLPRLATDQTASLTPVRNGAPVDILLPLLRTHFRF